MKISPLGDRVVLKSAEVEETTKSGIILTGNSKAGTEVKFGDDEYTIVKQGDILAVVE